MNIMKQLVWLLLFIPVLLAAQTDERYLAGAVPVKDGKVVFSKEFKIPDYSKARIYDIMSEWANANFNGRVVYANPERGEIAAVVNKEYMEFSRTALSLDHTKVTYRLTIECSDGRCEVELGGIRYEYDVSYQREPEKYLAEEWITDKYALNKSQTKLNRISGKFRKGTINLADAYFEKIGNAFGNQLLSQRTAQANAGDAPAASTVPAATIVPAEPVVPAKPEAPAAPTSPAVAATPAAPSTPNVPAASATPAAPVVPQPATPAPEGFMELPSDPIPSTLLDMLPQNRMTVSHGSDLNAPGQQATWGGVGDLFGKRIASINVAADSQGAPIGRNEIYRLSFCREGEQTPWMVIECRQQGETAGGRTTTVMGEILHVWIK